MKIITTIFALMAMTASAIASPLCIEQTIDGGQTSSTYVASYTDGPDGWDGQGGQCTKSGSSRIWVGPRTADGICMTPDSIVGTAPGAVLATAITDNPDIDQFAKLDVKATAKAVAKELVLAIIQHRPPNPVAPIYKPWADGSCN